MAKANKSTAPKDQEEILETLTDLNPGTDTAPEGEESQAPPAVEESQAPPAAKAAKAAPVKEAKAAGPKMVTIRGIEDHECTIHTQKYFLRKGENQTVPEDVAMILQNSQKAIRIS